ncbi:MAG: HAMP domain-containing histidine kinase [Anaerolineales bacterium]|nr:HAMP domain-containing histidine kinase [Anaerolineales bacterium]
MPKHREYHRFYLLTISLLGLFVVFVGLLLLPTIDQPVNFVLLLLLASVAEIVATYFKIGESKIAYEVGTAVGLAAVPFYGPTVASLIVVASSLSFWLYKTWGKPVSRRNWEQLAFNSGMHTLATHIAGIVFIYLNGGDDNFIVHTVFAWIAAAAVYDQVNLWLLIILLRLMRGNQLKPIEFWLENRWAMVVNMSVLAIGGFFLSAALANFQWIGIVIFFLPILLSSFSFNLYVRKMRAYTDNLESLISERTQALSEAMRDKDAFLAVLTHDMKTPLTSIGLYADMLDKDPNIIHKKPHFPSFILRSQRMLTDIVNNIVDLEKLQTVGEILISKEAFEFVAMLEDVMETMTAQVESKNITLSFDRLSGPIVIEADKHQIERVMQNLISNAIKYTPRGGQIAITLTIENDTLTIAVADNGYGIPADEVPYIFDRYRRVAGHEKVAVGTGLGLAITKALVEAHDGVISVVSEENVGSTFTVQLPVCQEVGLLI